MYWNMDLIKGNALWKLNGLFEFEGFQQMIWVIKSGLKIEKKCRHMKYK